MTLESDERKGDTAVDRALSLLGELAARGEPRDVAAAAKALGLPYSTARRLAGTLERHGLVERVAPGRYAAGPRLDALAQQRRPYHRLAGIVRPIARRLAEQVGGHVHVGVFEGDMVTYIICERSRAAGELFTREGMQLEAYCTAIGKMLLAQLPDDHLDSYLSGGPFIALTEATITDAARLRSEVAAARRSGSAVEIGEIAADLACMAMPIRDATGVTVAAVSIAWRPGLGEPDGLRRMLAGAARRMHRKLHGQRAKRS